ncbi:MAG: patatin-like phospholipase family protein [Planctomycetota bacterium]
MTRPDAVPHPERLLARLDAPGPKRVLALDGGGVRGAIALGFLERIEGCFRAASGRPDLRLADVFDLIGGTSTGSILAAGLAIGMEVHELRRYYTEAGPFVFAKRRLRFWQSLYDARPLIDTLREGFGEICLGGPEIRTGLCIVTKRADTNSLWPLLNHPRGRYYERNRQIRVRDAVRASAAAPIMFRPASVEVGPGQSGVFVDGGVSMANNPALLLFLVATLKGYPFHWPAGERDLLLVSVGTGTWERTSDPVALAGGHAFRWLAQLPEMLIADGSALVETVLQAISRTPTPSTIDREVGDLGDDVLLGQPALRYVRYNVRLDATGLHELGLAELEPRLTELRSVSGGTAIDAHTRIGRAAARVVRPEHLAGFIPG